MLGPVIDSICSAPAGSVVQVAVFSMSIPRFADALIDAHQRGVHVQVLIEAEEAGALWRRLSAALSTPTGPADLSFARACPGSCLAWGDDSSLHTKLFLFSAAGQARQVTVVGSANPTRAQALVAANNSYTTVGLPAAHGLYEAAREYFEAMAAAAVEPQRQDPDYYRTVTGLAGRQQLWFFPRRDTGGSGDTVREILNDVECSTEPHRTSRLHIAMFKWSWRRADLADTLISMGEAGCTIDILWTGDNVSAEIRAALAGRHNIRVTDTTIDLDGDGIADHYTHDKYWLIDGFSRGGRIRHVITGSPNFTLQALRSNCEVMARLTSAEDYEAYLGDWHAQRGRIPFADQRTLTAERLAHRPPRIRAAERADS